jgi:hypothetical protein
MERGWYIILQIVRLYLLVIGMTTTHAARRRSHRRDESRDILTYALPRNDAPRPLSQRVIMAKLRAELVANRSSDSFSRVPDM